MNGKTMGNMPDMMSKMMEGCGSEKMMGMMQECMGMMLSHVPNEKRGEFVLKMIVSLMKEGGTGMSEQEKKEFVAKVVETVRG